MVGKIRAAIEKNNKEDFAVIARTESLIQGHGHRKAIERAKAYTETGCNGFLIHSKSKDPLEVLKFADLYHASGIKTPLVVVPTTYNQITVEDMNNAGISLAIYANYSVRATVGVLQNIFERMIVEGTLSAANTLAEPMDTIFDLVDINELKENQAKYGS